MLKKILSLVFLGLVLTLSGNAQRTFDLSRQGTITETTVAALPATGNWNGRVYIVTDGTAGALCGTGGSTARALCTWDGDSWEATGDGGTGASGAPTGATYLTNSADATLTAEVVINSEATLEAAIGAVDLAKVSDNVASATALAANPADCGANLFAQFIDASGNLTCGAITDAAVPDTITLTNLTQITTRAYSDLQSIPSTFAPAAHVLNGADHTVSALTTGHYLRANSATTFGFAQPAFSELSGAVTDAQVPNTITVDLATLATTATTANAGDSATSFFPTGTLEDARLSANVVLLDAVQSFVTGTKTVTSKFDIGGGTLEIPNGITLPATCAVGEQFMDTDATTGQRHYLCESTNTWALQGDGAGGGSADFLGSYASPTERTLAAGTATFTAIAQTIDTEADAATDDWTGATCAAGVSFSVRPASDARSIVIISSSIPTPTGTDLTMDQDGDLALVICQTANTPEVILFHDEDGQTYVKPIDGGLSLTGTTTRPAGTVRVQLSRHVDNCQALTDGLDGEVCRQKDTDVRYTCEPIVGPCDSAAEWVADPSGGAETNSLETLTTGILSTEIPIGTGANTVVYAALSGDATMSNTGVVTVVDDLHAHTGTSISALDAGDITTGELPDARIADTITASNYLALVGGTLTGQLVADNLGVEFEESDTNPACAAGNYNVFADLSETKLKKCTNGTVTDLDTGGGASALDDLSDVVITAGASGEVLRHNGTNWVDAQLAYSDLSGTPTQACEIDIMPWAVASSAAGPGVRLNGATTAVNGDNGYLLFDLAAERAIIHHRMPACYTGQAMDLVFYVRKSVDSTSDVTLTIKTACFAHDEGSVSAPTYNTHGTRQFLWSAASTGGDLIVNTVTGLTLTGCAAQELLMIDLEATTVTAGNLLILAMALKNQ